MKLYRLFLGLVLVEVHVSFDNSSHTSSESLVESSSLLLVEVLLNDSLEVDLRFELKLLINNSDLELLVLFELDLSPVGITALQISEVSVVIRISTGSLSLLLGRVLLINGIVDL